jgi:rare lipoprotein A
MLLASCSSVNGMFLDTLTPEPAPVSAPDASETPQPAATAEKEEPKRDVAEIHVVRPGDPEHPGLPVAGKLQTLVKNLGLGALFSPEKGIASFYITDKERSRRKYPAEAKMTAAHKTLPIGSVVRCTRPDTGESVIVTINDRGPFIKGRVIDLSRTAAAQLHMLTDGLVDCTVEVLMYPAGELKKAAQSNALGNVSNQIPQSWADNLPGN